MKMDDKVQVLLDKSLELHTAVQEIITNPSPEYLREQADMRHNFKLDLKKLYNGIKNQIVELEKINRRIGEEMTRQTLDANQLDSQKITLYSERKRQGI